MKAILLIALCVFVAQAYNVSSNYPSSPSSYNYSYPSSPSPARSNPAWAVPIMHLIETLKIDENHNGFADELKLNSTIREEAKECISTIKKAAHTLATVFKSGSGAKIALESVGVLETLKIEVQEGCQTYIQSLIKLAYENRNSTSFSDSYQAYIHVQSEKAFATKFVVELIEAIVAKRPYNFGQVVGKLFKVGAQMNTNERPAQYTYLNSTKPIPAKIEFNFTTFNKEFWPGYFKALNKTDYNIEDFVKCGEAQVNASQRIQELSRENATSFMARVGTKINIIQEIISMGSECSAEIQLIMPFWRKFKASPLRYIGKSYYNQMSQAPELFWLITFINRDIPLADYGLAGEALGTFQTLMSRGL